MLTQTQRQVLDELMAGVPARQAQSASSPSIMPEGIEALLKLFGSSPEALQGKVQALLQRKSALQTAFLDWNEANPMDAAFAVLGTAAWAFYQAENGVNPKINSYVDAYYYISTCASVGYADIFAVTQTGKAIAALVMTLGPALAAKALDRPI